MRGSSVQPDQLLTQAHALANGLWGAHEVLHHTCLIFQPPVTVLFDMSVAHTDICLYVCMCVACQRVRGNRHLMQMHVNIHLSDKQAPVICPNSV